MLEIGRQAVPGRGASNTPVPSREATLPRRIISWRVVWRWHVFGPGALAAARVVVRVATLAPPRKQGAFISAAAPRNRRAPRAEPPSVCMRDMMIWHLNHQRVTVILAASGGSVHMRDYGARRRTKWVCRAWSHPPPREPAADVATGAAAE